MRTFLTEQYAKAVAREYRSRLVFVAATLSSVVFLCGIALAMPAYLLLHAKASALAPNTAQAGRLSDVEASAAALKEKTATAETIAGEVRMATVIEKILSRATRGISISGMSLRRGTGASAISLSGIADTRENLVAFQKALEGEPAFSKVVLPVSALAKGKDVAFTLSIDSNF